MRKYRLVLQIFNLILILLIANGGIFILPEKIARAEGSILRINEVAPSEKGNKDWIEFYVAQDGDFSEYTVWERTGQIKKFPSDFQLKKGDFIVLHINQEGTDEDNKTGKGENGYWDLFSSDKGLTGTKNVIYLENKEEQIIDALCFSKQEEKEKWPGTQQKAFNKVIEAHQWKGTKDGGAEINKNECVFWENKSGKSLGRDENSSDSDNLDPLSDWEIKENQTPGRANRENQPPEILSASLSPSSVVADGKTQITVKAKVSDPDGLFDITSSTIDLSEIGQEDFQEMKKEDEGTFSYKFTIPFLLEEGEYSLPITVFDSQEHESTYNLNLKVSSPSFSDKIIINEIFPNPQGSDKDGEFIELKNTGSETVDLENWIIADKNHQYKISKDDFLSTEIPKGGFFVIYRSSSNIVLNNSGQETISLYQPNEKLLSSVEYSEKAPEGQSYSFTGDSWAWTTTPTPAQENIINKKNNPPQAEAGDDKEGSVGQEIIFDGSDSFDEDGDDLSFVWDFGDDQKGYGSQVTHIYNKAGNYKVSLEVSDNRGGKDKDTLKVKIAEKEEENQKEEKEDRTSGPFSDQIIISEFLPNPEGSDTGNDNSNSGEWIELYNKGEEEVNLEGWQLDDEEEGSNPYTIKNKTIKAKEYLVFYRSETKIALNNNGDEVRLIHPDGKITSKVSYNESAKENVAYALDENGNWQWTETPTPGKANIISAPKDKEDETKDKEDNTEKEKDDQTTSKEEDNDKTDIQISKISIAQARKENKNTQVVVEGIVSVEPKILGKKIFYIQDQEAGIQIYFSKAEFPVLRLGDQVEIKGEISEKGGEKKINIKEKEDIKIISHKNPPLPKRIKTGQVGEKYEGQLVEVAGEITRTSGNVFYLNDGTGEAKVYIKKTTNINKPKMKKGQKFSLKGIVSEAPSDYRILPRYQSDLGNPGLASSKPAGIKSKDLPSTGNNLWITLGLSLIFALYLELPKIAYKFRK